MFLRNILDAIYILISIVSSFIIVLHLFKIRYLDYFLTIEDVNINKRIIEEVIEENKNEIVKENDKKIVFEKKKEKIVIRDPKHSSYSFVNALGNLVLLFCRTIAFCIGCFALISFVCLLFSLFVCVFYILDDLIFMGIAIAILSLVFLNFLVIYLLYSFIFNQKLKKYLFIGFMMTVTLMALGGALTFVQMLDFKYINNLSETSNTVTKTTYIEIDNKTELALLEDPYAEIIIDNHQKDVKVEITCLKDINVTLSYYQNHSGNDYFYIDFYDDYLLDDFNVIIKMIKNHEWYSDIGLIKIKIYVSESNLEILKNNITNRKQFIN